MADRGLISDQQTIPIVVCSAVDLRKTSLATGREKRSAPLPPAVVVVQDKKSQLSESIQVKQTSPKLELSASFADTSSGANSDVIDTTADFLRVFQGKTQFDSWEEFSVIFEQFQKETGSAFKPKSATTSEYANERGLAKERVPDKYVYLSVKMVCLHYGAPPTTRVKPPGAKQPMARGCEAVVTLRYKNGYLVILHCNLEHRNHKLFCPTDIIRPVRGYTFTDDVDLLMSKLVLKHRPFSARYSDKEWVALVEDIHSQDPLMRTVTVRAVKKRIRFLIDRYIANSNGKPPSPCDEMGIILHELAAARQDSLAITPKPPVRPYKSKKRGRGDSEDEQVEEHLDLIFGCEDSIDLTPGGQSPDRDMERCVVIITPSQSSTDLNKEVKPFIPDPIQNTADTSKEKKLLLAKNPKKNPIDSNKGGRSRVVTRSANKGKLAASTSDSGKNVQLFLQYMEQYTKLRQHEIELRRDELEVNKKMLELQKEKFELDRMERLAHLELLKSQLGV